ncbi:uncharacterized protein OCT59_014131 [Rhizophagus irregularis]|uniref:Uncharacterized protein n=2 Tax=Rhizophagus irregularis TaxID=588596 RepID=A0A015M998_RHIIW|nr:hypothetical protein GLOIN_2v1773303 [Rhizophagus irregularis DAOM 181602=DAOM 197198]EXX63438.1 hypothetical protein RirG_152370 [Rhizophagus irregularis DAOM 197198w]UZO21746.1 hypothetical protein OCT59_014131 [Rhizophagus irregularis]POG72837.1 hypothetical protein GLOIN_2v1773303 [Rhizophagus irregularis DAOM 181602=DAOM 197198]CAG8695001.1 22083_t:CDS:2 [Rhizophagus irregularis]GBC14003.1 hypothetical protein GLOIN_2v1773303 [Rhizophagus irregularis DAOM 181602=DAOM 197198]|eukprot:XP_025179703.1 hypothetical protein GLOIN_2v1773303 [Rhizophagus irregularis DAOM 181602=DAOM 197198]
MTTIKMLTISEEHYPKPSVPEQLISQIQEQDDDMQAKNKFQIDKNDLIFLRNDPIYRYDEEVDIFQMYFAKESAGYSHSEEAIKNKVLISYDNDGKIFSVDIFKASKNLSCHLYDTQIEIDNKPPLVIYPIYHKFRDELRVYFHGSIPPTIKFEKSEEEGVEVEMDDANKIVALLFQDSSKKVREDC